MENFLWKGHDEDRDNFKAIYKRSSLVLLWKKKKWKQRKRISCLWRSLSRSNIFGCNIFEFKKKSNIFLYCLLIFSSLIKKMSHHCKIWNILFLIIYRKIIKFSTLMQFSAEFKKFYQKQTFLRIIGELSKYYQ